MKSVRIVVGCLAALLAGCDPNDALSPSTLPRAQAPWFEDVTDRVGLHFIHNAGHPGTYFMPQVMGSGAALFDYDADGLLDVYLIQNAGPDSAVTNRLFHQKADGTFEDVTASSGLGVAGYGMGAAAGDIDNDGRPDLVVTEYGRTRMFLNKGGRFEDVSTAAGIDNPDWGTSAAFFDYDRDGWLDLVVVNYVRYAKDATCADEVAGRDFCGPHSFTGTLPKLYRNLTGDRTRQGKLHPLGFEDVTHRAGLGQSGSRALGVAGLDFDGDAQPDILITNDAQPNRLWINRGDGTFADEAGLRGLAYDAAGRPQANMGIALGDADGNALTDVYVTHLTEENNVLWRQEPAGVFTDGTSGAGLARTTWRGTGFGTVLADFDHDGGPDLALVNGRVAKRPASPAPAAGGSFWSPYTERNQLVVNDNTGRFRDASEGQPFCARADVGRGLACGDLDGDGAVDLVTTSVAGRARLWRNVTPDRGHWLIVRAVLPDAGGRDAYGARVVVTASGRRQVGWINPAYSYLCSNDPRAHFGLGGAGRYDEIEVTWPDGNRERFGGGAGDRVVALRQRAPR